MQDVKERVALGSVVTSAGLTFAKAVVGLLSGSLAILSEAAHSLIDLVATVMTYFAIRISGKPADAEHHYGHGKVESVAAFAETGLLFVLSAVVIWEAAHRLFGGREATVEATLVAFAVIVLSIVVDFFRARLLYRVAADTASEALQADALHFGSDMWSSLAVLVGLAGVRLGFAWADSVAAIVVAVFVCLAGWRLGRRTLETLTDTAPEGAAERISAVARRIPGVVAVARVRARPVGPTLFVDLAAVISRTLPLDRVSAIKNEIVRAVRAEMPQAEVTITTDPRALDDETVLERVMVIARNRGLAGEGRPRLGRVRVRRGGARARHLRDGLDIRLLHPARARHVDPTTRGAFCDLVEEEPRGQLSDERARGRGAQVLLRRARHCEVVARPRRRAD